MSEQAQTRYYTSGDWVNKQPVLLGEWPSQEVRRSGARSRTAASGTIKAKALLKRLVKLGVKG